MKLRKTIIKIDRKKFEAALKSEEIASAKVLADLLGIPQATMYRYYSRKNEVPLKNAAKLGARLGDIFEECVEEIEI